MFTVSCVLLTGSGDSVAAPAGAAAAETVDEAGAAAVEAAAGQADAGEDGAAKHEGQGRRHHPHPPHYSALPVQGERRGHILAEPTLTSITGNCPKLLFFLFDVTSDTLSQCDTGAAQSLSCRQLPPQTFSMASSGASWSSSSAAAPVRQITSTTSRRDRAITAGCWLCPQSTVNTLI